MNDPSGFERPEGWTDLDTPPSQPQLSTPAALPPAGWPRQTRRSTVITVLIAGCLSMSPWWSEDRNPGRFSELNRPGVSVGQASMSITVSPRETSPPATGVTDFMAAVLITTTMVVVS